MKKEISEKTRLNDLNNERVETTKKRVAHAIELVQQAQFSIRRKSDADLEHTVNEFNTEIAHAVNILEAANEEMKWACEHFRWNDEICMQIDDAIKCFGSVMASIIRFNKDEHDIEEVICEIDDGLVKLSKSLATLIRWFDDEADVSEV